MKIVILVLVLIIESLSDEPLKATCKRDDSKGIVVCQDKINGMLIWQDEYNKVTKNQQGSKKYCQNLKYAGYDNWRLPSPHELLSIVDRTRREPSINQAFKYTNSAQYWYWTSGFNAKGNAWGVHFYSGVIRNDSKIPAIRSVRCVR